MNQIVAEGTWPYAEGVLRHVFIIEADVDFWYEIAAADGTLEDGETPLLNDAGKRYYVTFRGVDPGGRFWPDGPGYLTIDDAVRAAEGRTPTPIEWT